MTSLISQILSNLRDGDECIINDVSNEMALCIFYYHYIVQLFMILFGVLYSYQTQIYIFLSRLSDILGTFGASLNVRQFS